MIIMKWEKDGSMEKDWLALQDIKQNQSSPAFDIICKNALISTI